MTLPHRPTGADDTPTEESSLAALKKSQLLQALITGTRPKPEVLRHFIDRALENPRLYLSHLAAAERYLTGAQGVDAERLKALGAIRCLLEDKLSPPPERESKNMTYDRSSHIEVGKLRTETFRKIIADIAASGVDRPLVDLGAAACIFSRIAYLQGFSVTAVDARTDRVPPYINEINFVQSDVRDFDLSGFGVILILGILYHLTLKDQIDLLDRCPIGSDVVVDTEIYVPELVVRSENRNRFADRVITDGEYEGISYPELNNTMASWKNPESFWHSEESIHRLFKNCGFSTITPIEPTYVSKYGGRKWFVLKK